MVNEWKEGAIVMFSDVGEEPRKMRVTRVRRTGPNTTDVTLEAVSGPRARRAAEGVKGTSMVKPMTLAEALAECDRQLQTITGAKREAMLVVRGALVDAETDKRTPEELVRDLKAFWAESAGPPGPLCVCGHHEEHHEGGACTWAWNDLPPPAKGCSCEAFAAAKCTTCGEPYTVPPTRRATLCSNVFHCCRDCTWKQGRRTQRCARHATPEMEREEILAASLVTAPVQQTPEKEG